MSEEISIADVLASPDYVAIFRLSDCAELDPENWDWYVHQIDLIMLYHSYYEQFFDDFVDGKD